MGGRHSSEHSRAVFLFRVGQKEDTTPSPRIVQHRPLSQEFNYSNPCCRVDRARASRPSVPEGRFARLHSLPLDRRRARLRQSRLGAATRRAIWIVLETRPLASCAAASSCGTLWPALLFAHAATPLGVGLSPRLGRPRRKPLRRGRSPPPPPPLLSPTAAAASATAATAAAAATAFATAVALATARSLGLRHKRLPRSVRRRPQPLEWLLRLGLTLRHPQPPPRRSRPPPRPPPLPGKRRGARSSRSRVSARRGRRGARTY